MNPEAFMLVAFSVLGKIGNVMVLYFLIRKPTTVPHIFVWTLVAVHLVTCVITIPLNAWLVYFNFRTDNLRLCRCCSFVTTGTHLFTSILMVQIAVDRLLAFTKPYSRLRLKKMITVGIILVIATFSGVCGYVSALQTYLLPTRKYNNFELSEAINVTNRNYSIYSKEQICLGGMNLYRPSPESRTFFWISHNILFLLSVFITITIYIIIYKYIENVVVKHQEQNTCSEREQGTLTDCTFELTDRNQESADATMEETPLESFWINVKYSRMMFTAFIMFVVANMSTILMMLALLPYNSTIFFMCFSYCVLHPITLAIFDEDIMKTLFPSRYTCCRCVYSSGAEQLRPIPIASVSL